MSHPHAHTAHRRWPATLSATTATILLAEVVSDDTEVLSPAARVVEVDALTEAEGVSL